MFIQRVRQYNKRMIHNASYIHLNKELNKELNEERMKSKRFENEIDVLNLKLKEQKKSIDKMDQMIKEINFEKSNFETRLSKLQREYFYKYEFK